LKTKLKTKGSGKDSRQGIGPGSRMKNTDDGTHHKVMSPEGFLPPKKVYNFSSSFMSEPGVSH